YMNQLVSHLSQSYGDLSHKINFKINSNNMYLNINTAIPCGMIINELISNSLKYAFPDGRSGEICIDLSSEDDSFKLIVSDNGVGIKGDLKIKDSKTLGFRLIDTLVKQIDGKMSLDTINGTRCEIHFKGLK
ncbi:MAG: sensor histidine kinase, partial [Methanotrichaceae archaeon]